MRQRRTWSSRVEARRSSEGLEERSSALGLMSAPTLLRGPRPQGRGLKLLSALCVCCALCSFWVVSPLSEPPPPNTPSELNEPSESSGLDELSETAQGGERAVQPHPEGGGFAELKGAPGFAWRVSAPRASQEGLTSCLRGGEEAWRAELLPAEVGEPQGAPPQSAAELEGVRGVMWSPRDASSAPLKAISVAYEGAHLWVRSALSPLALPSLTPLMNPEASGPLRAPPPLLREALTLHLALTACLRGETSELHDPQRALVWGPSRWPLSGEDASLSAWFEVLSEGRSHQTRGLERLGLRELALKSAHPRARTLLRALTLSLLTEGARAMREHWGAWRLSEAQGSPLLIWRPPHQGGDAQSQELEVSAWLEGGGEASLSKAMKGAQRGALKESRAAKRRPSKRRPSKPRKAVKVKPKKAAKPKKTAKPKTTRVKLRYE